MSTPRARRRKKSAQCNDVGTATGEDLLPPPPNPDAETTSMAAAPRSSASSSEDPRSSEPDQAEPSGEADEHGEQSQTAPNDHVGPPLDPQLAAALAPAIEGPSAPLGPPPERSVTEVRIDSVPVGPGECLETVDGFDRAVLERGSRTLETSSSSRAPDASLALLPRRMLRSIPEPGSETERRILEVVIGADDRVQVEATDDYPWRCICELAITAADGSSWSGTGWLAGPRLVVTAGHCVHMAERGGWVREIRLSAAGSGGDWIAATRFTSVSGWVGSADERFDYGAIILPPSDPLGLNLGYLGVGFPEQTWLAQTDLNLGGYPSDKLAGTLWYHARRAASITDRLVIYNIDTAGGQSGAPVWVALNGQRFCVGIHSAGALSGNSAVRVTRTVAENILAWSRQSSP